MDFKKFGLWICVLAVCALFWFFVIRGFSGCRGCSDDTITNLTPIVNDPALLGKVSKDQARDTVFVFIDNIKWKEGKASVIYQVKVDSGFYQKTWDVMLRVNKRGSHLEIDAFNENDSLLKRYIYENVGNDFIAASANNRLVIKSKRWYWNGVKSSLEYSSPLNRLNEFSYKNFTPKITTGINYMDKVHLDAGFKYDLNSNDLKATVELGLNLFK